MSSPPGHRYSQKLIVGLPGVMKCPQPVTSYCQILQRQRCLQSSLPRFAAFSHLCRSCFSGIVRHTSFRRRYTSLHRSLHRLPATAAGAKPKNVSRHTNNAKLNFKISVVRFIAILLSNDRCTRPLFGRCFVVVSSWRFRYCQSGVSDNFFLEERT